MQIICTSLQTDNHASTPPCSSLQAGCHSCQPTNSVKALKAWHLSQCELQTVPFLVRASAALYKSCTRWHWQPITCGPRQHGVPQRPGTNKRSSTFTTVIRNGRSSDPRLPGSALQFPPSGSWNSLPAQVQQRHSTQHLKTRVSLSTSHSLLLPVSLHLRTTWHCVWTI